MFLSAANGSGPNLEVTLIMMMFSSSVPHFVVPFLLFPYHVFSLYTYLSSYLSLFLENDLCLL